MLPGLSSAIVGTGGSDVVFVGGVTGSKTSSSNSTLALNSGLTGGIASAAASGDFVLAVYGVGSNSDDTLAITDGSTAYTLIGSELNSADGTRNINLRVAYKFITADTTTTFGGVSDATQDAGAKGIFVFRGVNVSTPLDVAATTATGIDTTRPNPPSITPVTAGSIIVSLGTGMKEHSETMSFSSSDLDSFRTQYAQGTLWGAVLGVGLKTGGGTFDPATFTLATGSDSTTAAWAAMSIALRPA
jgi:hypothetical protein